MWKGFKRVRRDDLAHPSPASCCFLVEEMNPLIPDPPPRDPRVRGYLGNKE